MSPCSHMNKQVWCFQNLFNQDSMFFLLLLPLLVVQPYMCAPLHQHPLNIIGLWAGVCAIMYAEAQGVFFWALVWIIHGVERDFENLFLSQCQLQCLEAHQGSLSLPHDGMESTCSPYCWQMLISNYTFVFMPRGFCHGLYYISLPLIYSKLLGSAHMVPKSVGNCWDSAGLATTCNVVWLLKPDRCAGSLYTDPKLCQIKAQKSKLLWFLCSLSKKKIKIKRSFVVSWQAYIVGNMCRQVVPAPVVLDVPPLNLQGVGSKTCSSERACHLHVLTAVCCDVMWDLGEESCNREEENLTKNWQ